MTAPRFLIVTPTFQSEAYLNACIHSIVSQAGVFEVRYHVQDGGSSDGTEALIRAWQEALDRSPEVFSCRVTLTYDSAPDKGMYDALSRGFMRLAPRPGDIMAWLNSDDIFAPGAFAAVAGVMTEFPQIGLCGGPSAMLDARGRIVWQEPARPVVASLLRAGLHEGRRLPFIMQEGTFWTQALWDLCGGLDPRFRLAGDWDLWRRMAEHSDYTRLNVTTGFHRRRPGQLSQDMDAYYREVDAALAGEPAARRDAVYSAYLEANAAAGLQPAQGYEGPVASWDRETAEWTLRRQAPRRLPPPRLTQAGAQQDFGRGALVFGAGAFEPSDEARGLPFGARWINEPTAGLVIHAARAGRLRVTLICRPAGPDLTLKVRHAGETIHECRLSIPAPDQDQWVSFDVWAAPGPTTLEIDTAFAQGDLDQRLLLVDALVAEAPVEVVSPPPGAARRSIAIAVMARERPNALARSLASLAGQAGLQQAIVGVFCVAESSVFDVVTEAFPVADVIDVSADPDARAVAFLDRGEFALRLVLEAGVELTQGALAAVIAEHAAHPSDAYEGATVRPGRGGPRMILPGASDTASVLFLSPSGWRAKRPGDASGHSGGDLTVRRLNRALSCTTEYGAPGAVARLLWLHGPNERGTEAVTRILRRMDLDVRALAVGPSDTAETIAAQTAGWDPGVTLASAGVAARYGGKIDAVVGEPLLQAAEIATDRPYLAPGGGRRLRRALGLNPSAPMILAPGSAVREAAGWVGADGVVVTLGKPPAKRVRGAVIVGFESPDPALLAYVAAAVGFAVATQDPDGALVRAAAARGGASLFASAAALGRDDGATVQEGASSESVATRLRDLIVGSGSRSSGLLGGFAAGGAEPVRLLSDGGSGQGLNGGLTFASNGVFYLGTPPSAAARALWLNIEVGENTRASLVAGADIRELTTPGEHLVDVAPTGLAGLRRIELRIAPMEAGGVQPKCFVALADSEVLEASEDKTSGHWSAGEGFGPEQPPAPGVGLSQPYRWILGRHARLAVRNPAAGWRRLNLALRTETQKQRLMVMSEGRILAELPIQAKDLSRRIEVSALLEAPPGWCDFDLVFQSDEISANGSAVLESASLGPARAPSGGPKGRWSVVAGIDFEEPAAPQFGLEEPFRWCLSGCQIFVQPPRAGRTRVTVAYRSAMPEQVITATVDKRILARSGPARGDLRQVETLTFETELPKGGADIGLEADRLLRSGRKLAFIIQAVTIEPVD